MWLVTGAGLFAALMVVHEWRQGYIPSPLLAAVYATFSKIAEAAFLSWVTVACMTGHAGNLSERDFSQIFFRCNNCFSN